MVEVMEFDEAYQRELVNKMTNRTFLERTAHLIHSEYFDPDLEQIVTKILSHWKRTKKSLTKSQVRQLFTRFGIKQERVSLDGFEFDQDELVDFAKDRILRIASIQFQSLRDQGKFHKAVQVISESVKRFPHVDGKAEDMLLNQKPLPKRKNLIPTGIRTLDRALSGGISGGDIATVLARTGGGKTSFLCHVSATAVEAGLKVFYATLEVPGLEVQGKLRRRLVGSEKPSQIGWKKVSTKLRRKKASVLVLEHPPNTINVSEMEQEIPDGTNLVVIDYADLLRSIGTDFGFSYEQLGVIYAELKRVAMEREIPIWTASQINRPAYSNMRAGADTVEGSLKKATNSNLILSLNQPDDEVDGITGNSLMNIFVDKNTFGPRNVQIPVTVHWAKSKFEEGHYG
jgi:hypothetical protein